MFTNINKLDIDKEVRPLLKTLVLLKPGNEQHDVVKQLSKWLSDPNRSGEAFVYAIGDLAKEVFDKELDSRHWR